LLVNVREIQGEDREISSRPMSFAWRCGLKGRFTPREREGH
jgi:hypothetical protein